MSFIKKAWKTSRQNSYEGLEKESPTGFCSNCTCGCSIGQNTIPERQRQADREEEDKLRREYEIKAALDLAQKEKDEKEADEKQREETRSRRLMHFPK